MQPVSKEKRPVIYNAGATKLLSFSYPAGKECFVMHWHERLEILRIKSGEMEYTLGSHSGVARAGQAIIIPPRMAHYARAGSSLEYDVLMFDLRYFYNETEVCKSTLTSIFEGNAVFECLTEDKDIVSSIDSVCHGAHDSLEAVGRVYLLLHLFLTRGIITLTKGESRGDIRRIVDYIEQNFDNELSTAALCEHFGYTQGHFCRKFKKATGLTPVTYIKIYRLEKAFNMLKDGEGSVCEIAEKCGFPDSNYFTRCFKAHYKFPPTHYKK
ncbi:MAG: helix-turn-helix transcriptional regulator [Clostridia bacterium]|nr:helix-turn-helix transcriptional regulator [Clostridia bacterium]